jgi:hypothetical protein
MRAEWRKVVALLQLSGGERLDIVDVDIGGNQLAVEYITSSWIK